MKKTSFVFAAVFLMAASVFAKSGSKSEASEPVASVDENPIVSSDPAVSADFIFNTDSVGVTTITIRRSEWNKMGSYYDFFYKNENLVKAESYEYEKDGQKWKINNVGLRPRGNTSRLRPSGKDFPTDKTGHLKPNAEWNPAYYEYAATCSDYSYRQAHLKIDFEMESGENRKMSDCMKGVGLKRCDSLFSREMFCYYIFHQYGIWTVPRASQTRVFVNFIEDVKGKKIIPDISKCKITKVDFGVYEMFEEVNTQSLKNRMSENGSNSAKNAWKNNSGDLWKCCDGGLEADSNIPSNFGCEQMEILNTDKAESEWEAVWKSYPYDLKTNKKNVDIATENLRAFITELDNLSKIDASTKKGIQARKAFYEKWMDVDLFIKTYAVSMLFGMDDDYWANHNNYYLYFDNGDGGSGKVYLIPFDYDNSLGCSICGDKVITDPFKWSYNADGTEKKDSPLMDRLLEVPEYKTKFAKILLEVSSQDEDSPWNVDNCLFKWLDWFTQVQPYVDSPDLRGWPEFNTKELRDDGGWKKQRHHLVQYNENIYEQVTENMQYWLKEYE